MSATSSASWVEPNRKPASAVTRIRNGNNDISADRESGHPKASVLPRPVSSQAPVTFD